MFDLKSYLTDTNSKRMQNSVRIMYLYLFGISLDIFDGEEKKLTAY